jgi:hypothetical protein
MNTRSFWTKVREKTLGTDPIAHFRHDHYIRHNQRRLEHLASLGLPIAGKTVLEVGAGIGDHTSFFVDRGCQLCVTEPRSSCVAVIKSRYPSLTVLQLDLDDPDPHFGNRFDIVYAYGLLYHLRKPSEAIEYLAAHCDDFLLLETCVSLGNEEHVNLVPENSRAPSQAVSAVGCRPTRPWVDRELKRHFRYVYYPITQPWHEEFPVDWSTQADRPSGLLRAIFIGSRRPIELPTLTSEMPMRQSRC